MTDRKLACIIGWPVAHSLSPAIHNAAFAALGLDWTYVPLSVRPGAVDEGMRLLRELDVYGANVTMPHKRVIVPLLDEVVGAAADLGAVNTIVRDGERFIGHNTDGRGFLNWLVSETGFRAEGKRTLILGAGGAARAIALALARAGSMVSVSARREEGAAEVALLHEAIEAASWAEPPSADLIVNATPARNDLPLEALVLHDGVVAVDLIYAPPLTPFVHVAADRGARAFDGLGMLVHQAALSFELWTGQQAPLEVMAEAAAQARSDEGG